MAWGGVGRKRDQPPRPHPGSTRSPCAKPPSVAHYPPQGVKKGTSSGLCQGGHDCADSTTTHAAERQAAIHSPAHARNHAGRRGRNDRRDGALRDGEEPHQLHLPAHDARVDGDDVPTQTTVPHKTPRHHAKQRQNSHPRRHPVRKKSAPDHPQPHEPDPSHQPTDACTHPA